MPAQDQRHSRQKRTHQKYTQAGIIAQPAEHQHPRQVQPRTTQAGVPVGAVRPIATKRSNAKAKVQPPDQSCKYSRWGKPEFCRPVPPVLLAELPASIHLSLLPRQNSGEPVKVCSITGQGNRI